MINKKTYVPVRMPDDILVRVKKMAGDQGRSVSETVGMLVMKSLDSGSESGPEIDQEIIRKMVESAVQASGLGDLRAEIRALERTLFEGQGKEPVFERPSGFSWTKEQATFLIYTLARLNRFFEEYNAAWGQHDPQVTTRAETANGSGKRAVKKYLPEGDDNVR